jgi:hypothetical protein
MYKIDNNKKVKQFRKHIEHSSHVPDNDTGSGSAGSGDKGEADHMPG